MTTVAVKRTSALLFIGMISFHFISIVPLIIPRYSALPSCLSKMLIRTNSSVMEKKTEKEEAKRILSVL